MKALILPGLNGSGPGHWQTIWAKKYPHIFYRVEEPDWEHPACDVWVANLEAAVRSSGKPIILVAHSLACLQVIHWAAHTTLTVAAALLVAPPNPNRPEAPLAIESFKPVPAVRLQCPSILIASTNDPYADLNYSRACAETWGSSLVVAGAFGHINAASRLDGWPEGFALFESLVSKSTS